MKQETRQVTSRNETFVQRQATKIWEETPHPTNPYIAETCRCHGYDLFELMTKRSFVDVLFLLFQGDLPNPQQAKFLETLMIALINPGPRHPATRAAMLAGVGKTDPTHILPISLSILGGSHLGAGEIEESMRFLRKQLKNDPTKVAQSVLAKCEPPAEGDWHPVPGFGNRFGETDPHACAIARYLSELPGARKILAWGESFSKALQPHDLGWLTTGVAAAALAELGFQPRAGAGLFQIISAPGMLAHGVELANKPFTAMPFPSDDKYIIENE